MDQETAVQPERQQGQEYVAQVIGLSKIYGKGDSQVVALDDVSVALNQGEFLAIMGPSGSGKSTLLNCWTTLDRPTKGTVEIGGYDVTQLNDASLTKLRRLQIGFIFQAYNLIPTLNAKDNILLPLTIANKTKLSQHQQSWFDEIVTALDIKDRLKHLPAEMSGGQQQRVAIARALMTQPRIIFADEPSGNLDTKSSNDLLSFLSQINASQSQAIVMVTHSVNVACYASRVIFLKDGKLFSSLVRPTPDTVTEMLKNLEK